MLRNRDLLRVLTASVSIGWAVSGVRAQVVPNESSRPFYAKGVNVIDVTVHNQSKIKYAGLAVSRDGVEFQPAEDLFTSISYSRAESRVVIVIVGHLRMGKDYFTFEFPGSYYVKAGVRFENDVAPLVVFDQSVEILPTSHADRSFLKSVGQPEVFRRLMGDAWFAQLPESAQTEVFDRSSEADDFRASIVIAELLRSTREREPWEHVFAVKGKSKDMALTWADTLWALAQEFPDSSYAPYSASYAGCCYLTPVFEAFRKEKKERQTNNGSRARSELELLAAAGREQSNFLEKAEAALSFAAAHGDAYLKPRALYYRALVAWLGGDFRKGTSLLDAAIAAAPGESTLTPWIAEQRKGLKQMKEVWTEPPNGDTP